MHDVVVIGGGIAGLTTAFDLVRRGLDAVVLEAGSTPGGNIGTLEVDGYRLETGPHSFMGSAENVWRLVEALGVEDEVEPASAAAANRYIVRDGRLMALPMSAMSFLTSGVLTFGGKLRLAAEPFIGNGADPQETAWDFFSRRFGEEAATYIMSPFISGVYAGDIRALGARAAFPKFWGFERETGSMIRGAMRYMREKRKRLVAEGKTVRKGLYSTRGGLGGLIAKVADTLGQRFCPGVEVQALEAVAGGVAAHTDGGAIVGRMAVLAAPPHRAAPLLERAIPSASELMRSIPMVPVTVAHWTCAATSSAEVPAGFGFLVPRVSGIHVLGTLFPSQLFAGRAPDGRHLFASYYGGATDPAAATLSDEELRELVVAEHEQIFGGTLDDVGLLRVLRHGAAIPQLLPDHPERIEALWREVGAVSGLVLAGNYLTGVGIEAAAESGFEAAVRCAEHLEARRILSGASSGRSSSPSPVQRRRESCIEWQQRGVE